MRRCVGLDIIAGAFARSSKAAGSDLSSLANAAATAAHAASKASRLQPACAAIRSDDGRGAWTCACAEWRMSWTAAPFGARAAAAAAAASSASSFSGASAAVAPGERRRWTTGASPSPSTVTWASGARWASTAACIAAVASRSLRSRSGSVSITLSADSAAHVAYAGSDAEKQ